MKLQYAQSLVALRKALDAGVELGVVKYRVNSGLWHQLQVGERILQRLRAGEHTVVCIPKARVDLAIWLLERPRTRWCPVEPEFLWPGKQEDKPQEFDFYCLESHQRLYSGIQDLAEFFNPQLILAGKVAGARSEYAARNVYHWASLFALQTNEAGRL